RLDGYVHAEASGQLFDRFDGIGRRRVDDVRGTETARPLEAPFIDVDGHDRALSGETGAEDRRITDAAAAEHGDGVAARHAAGVHRRAEAGHHPHPINPATSGGAFASTFTAWAASTSVSSANAPMPSAAESV